MLFGIDPRQAANNKFLAWCNKREPRVSARLSLPVAIPVGGVGRRCAGGHPRARRSDRPRGRHRIGTVGPVSLDREFSL